MATGFVLAGSVVGFMTANVMFWAYDMALLLAVATWILSGPVSALIYLALQPAQPMPVPVQHSRLAEAA